MLDKPNTTMTDDARKRLQVLDSEGHSASAISKALWNEFGIYKTRNAVIGMIHRMGLRKTREPRGRKRIGGGIIAAPVLAEGRKKPKSVNAGGFRVELPATSEREKSRVSNNHVGGRALRPAPVAAPVAPVEPPPVGGVGLLHLEHHHCRAILGRGADGLATFCGVPKASGSYCAEHARMFYVPAKERGEQVAAALLRGLV